MDRLVDYYEGVEGTNLFSEAPREERRRLVEKYSSHDLKDEELRDLVRSTRSPSYRIPDETFRSVTALLLVGADPDFFGSDGYTSLVKAIILAEPSSSGSQYFEYFRAFLRRDGTLFGDPNKSNVRWIDGKNVLETIATRFCSSSAERERSRYSLILRALAASGSDAECLFRSTALLEMLELKDDEVCEATLRELKEAFGNAFDVDRYVESERPDGFNVDRYGLTTKLTLLFSAVSNNKTRTARYLVTEAGADPSKRNGEGMPTPLHFAIFMCKVEMVEILLAAGADLNAKLDSELFRAQRVFDCLRFARARASGTPEGSLANRIKDIVEAEDLRRRNSVLDKYHRLTLAPRARTLPANVLAVAARAAADPAPADEGWRFFGPDPPRRI